MASIRSIQKNLTQRRREAMTTCKAGRTEALRRADELTAEARSLRASARRPCRADVAAATSEARREISEARSLRGARKAAKLTRSPTLGAAAAATFARKKRPMRDRKLFVGLLDAQIAGEPITDKEIKDAAYAIEHYEITTGDMSRAWHTTTPDRVGEYIDAQRALRERLKALEPPPKEDPELAALLDAIVAAEEQAQNYEDMENYKKASAARAKARDLKAKLQAYEAK